MTRDDTPVETDGGTTPVCIAVTGAGGRMGREVIELASDRNGVEVALAVNRSAVDDVRDHPVRTVGGREDLAEALADTEPDVLVDFTAPAATVEYAEACVAADVPIVTGTTGFDETDRERLDRASESVPVLVASNFSRGILALRRAVEEAVRALPGYDVELTETHHNGKRDAPSGTAKTILEDVEAIVGDGEDAPGRVHGREGDQPRTAGEIGVHARRAGDVTGEHELLLAGNREALELTHRAGDRGVFAAGALDAAAWLSEEEAGRYEFADVVDDHPNSDSNGKQTAERNEKPPTTDDTKGDDT
ncbi:Dihydrodipicolinate reductase [Halalkaliarchaeum sp. AArc-CO]|uniref:4-hydroxy-tetrahydrodipicolinate reductase n=1 Tax=unclassified Halalkaliarchaeum TaxID=2678344 RepID=UPI00217F17FA|nr:MULTISPECIES: 4-hydroxy-tetrahydrodipicolinate reductase [unclassified Halalkaliarchaeum]MDR5673799.1 4-hydroxy-tetrahydrodipicolinate reductase [Halalkaliarchaeum sp. AArc-GB]UWG50989.1 Dihydrodipicolinate reductase [Halalkaliarchaeum sp. AArc-CO]